MPGNIWRCYSGYPGRDPLAEPGFFPAEIWVCDFRCFGHYRGGRFRARTPISSVGGAPLICTLRRGDCNRWPLGNTVTVNFSFASTVDFHLGLLAFCNPSLDLNPPERSEANALVNPMEIHLIRSFPCLRAPVYRILSNRHAPFTLVLSFPVSLQLYRTSHRVSPHSRRPYSRQAVIPCPCVLVVSLLVAR